MKDSPQSYWLHCRGVCNQSTMKTPRHPCTSRVPLCIVLLPKYPFAIQSSPTGVSCVHGVCPKFLYPILWEYPIPTPRVHDVGPTNPDTHSHTDDPIHLPRSPLWMVKKQALQRLMCHELHLERKVSLCGFGQQESSISINCKLNFAGKRLRSLEHSTGQITNKIIDV